MSNWSEGYYKAAVVGNKKISLEELIEFSIASKMRSYTRALAKESNYNSLYGRFNELTTPASFMRFEGSDAEYWDGYKAALVDLDNCDTKLIIKYQFKYFNIYKTEIERSLKGFINRAKRTLKNSKHDFELINAEKNLSALDTIQAEFSMLTFEDLLAVK